MCVGELVMGKAQTFLVISLYFLLGVLRNHVPSSKPKNLP